MEQPYIFNIGLNRAGTTSLAEALNILGINTLHHKYRGARLVDLIQLNIHRNLRLFHGMDSNYRGFSDFAGQSFFKLIDEQYPGSKFILTTRDLNSWLGSRERKVLKNRKDPNYRYHFLGIDKENWTREYNEVHSQAKNYFSGREKDFLIIDIAAGEGWDKLCPFLDRPLPEQAFPHKNVSGS